MNGQNRKDPFRVRGDHRVDNLTVVEHLRLMNGADIRAEGAQVQWASAPTGTGSPTGTSVNMPMNGVINVNFLGGAQTLTVNNPFVSGAATPVTVVSASAGLIPSPPATVTKLPGQVVVSGLSAVPAGGSWLVLEVGPDSLPASQYSY